MVRAERDIQRPIKELPKGEVVFSKQLTLRKLLRIKPGEEGETKGLLNDVSFDFEVRDLARSLLHIASFSEAQPVGLSELFQLLQTAKPGGRSRDGQSLSGINADWRIILPEVRENESDAKRLYEYHRKHIPGFPKFEKKHFPLFWKVLNSGLPRHEEVNFFNIRLKALVDEKEVLAEYGKKAILSDPQKRQAMLRRHQSSFEDFVSMERYSMELDDLIRPRRRAKSPVSKESLGIKFYKHLIAGGKEKELEVAVLTRERIRITFVYRKNSVTCVLDNFQNGLPFIPADGFILLENGQTEIRKGDSFMRISMEEGEDGYKKPKVEKLHLTTPEPETMIPLIVWYTDKLTGERSYYCGNLDQFPNHDTLLGQLVVAAYSPKVRDQMPLEIKMIGIDGEEKTQPMLEAQTILLVPRFASNFLTQSPVILELEKLGLDRKSVH